MKKKKINFNDNETIYGILSIPSESDQEENDYRKDDWSYHEKNFIMLMLGKYVSIERDKVLVAFFDSDKHGCEYYEYRDKDGSELDSYVFNLKDAYEIFLKSCYNAYLKDDDFSIDEEIEWVKYNALGVHIASKYDVKVDESGYWFVGDPE